MEWIWDALKLLGAAVLGFGGGQAAIALDRRRANRDAEADWTVWPVPLTADVRFPRSSPWILHNSGNAKAFAVKLEIAGGALDRERLDRDLDRNESEMIRVTHPGNGQLLISWTSHTGKSMGPVSRLLKPAP